MAAYIVAGVIEQGNHPNVHVGRVFRDRTMLLETMGDTNLMKRYRMTREVIFSLIDQLAPLLTPPTKRSRSISPEIQVLVTLRFYAKGDFFSELSDIHGISSSSVSRVFTRVNVAIINTLGGLIHFPKSTAEERHAKTSFYEFQHFPNVLGCIDGTLIPIIRPTGDDEHAYVCRKGYHAINVQAICDAKLRFTNVVARWPGATHDSYIWQNCSLADYFQGNQANGWLLGDSGYACRPWLLTPVGNPRTAAEERYNKAHTKTRNTVERSFGLLKSRFRCLHKSGGCLPFTPRKCNQVIFATCLLHNYCINKRVPPPPELDDNDVDEDNQYNGPVGDGLQTRTDIINRLFS